METVDSVTRIILHINLDSLAHTEAQPHITLVALVLTVLMVVLYLRIIPDSLAPTEAQPRIILVALVLTVPMVVLYLRIIPDSLAHTEAQPHIMVDSPVPTVSSAKCLEPLPELMKRPKLLS